MIGKSLVALLFGAFYMILHVSEGNNFPPPLSAEEERRYFRLTKSGDMEARRILIEHNLRLVVHIVKKYYPQNKQSEEDLVSIGTIGLIKAIDTFDTEKGARFTTYAGKCVQNEILMFFRNSKKQAGDVSMNEAIDTDKDGNPLTYADILSTDDDIAEELFTKMSSAKAIAYIMKNLEKREREVLILRYGLNGKDPVTQREIAKSLGISRSYVSRIEKSALEKIAEYLRLTGY